MVLPLVAAGAVELGKDILEMVVKVGSSPEGLEWIGRKLKDKAPALRARIAKNQHVPVAEAEKPA